MNLTGKPDAVNLHVRFNEGDQSYNSGPYSTVSLLFPAFGAWWSASVQG